MKRSPLTAIALSILALIMAACGDSPTPEQETAVEAVYDKYMKITYASYMDPGDPTEKHIKEIKDLQNIDVSDCPDPVQEAWAKYLAAKRLHDPTANWKAMAAASSGDAQGSRKELDKLNELNEANSKLIKAFSRYSSKVAETIERDNR